MSAHTPGPWKLIWHGNERYPFPLSVHTVDDASWVTRDGTVSSEANARLIAAAPRMLDFIREYARLSLGTDTISEAARAILRDVEGESNG